MSAVNDFGRRSPDRCRAWAPGRPPGRLEKARQKRIAADEAAERRRSAKAGFANVNNLRRSTLLTVLCAVFAVYRLFPVRVPLINATKTQGRLHQYVRPGLRQDVRPCFDKYHREVFSPSGRDLRALAVPTLILVRGGLCRRRDLPCFGDQKAATLWPVPLPGRKAVFVGHRRDQRAGIALAVPQFPPVRQLGLTNTPWGHDHPSR